MSTVAKGRRATVFVPTFSYFMNRCDLHNVKVEVYPSIRKIIRLTNQIF